MKTKHYSALFALAILVAPATSFAVPAWSRQAGMSCYGCHATPTMQLTKTGLDYLKNGHRAEALKFTEDDMKWDNYLSLVWKGRAIYDDLDDAKTGLSNTQKPKINFEQHSFAPAGHLLPKGEGKILTSPSGRGRAKGAGEGVLDVGGTRQNVWQLVESAGSSSSLIQIYSSRSIAVLVERQAQKIKPPSACSGRRLE